MGLAGCRVQGSLAEVWSNQETVSARTVGGRALVFAGGFSWIGSQGLEKRLGLFHPFPLTNFLCGVPCLGDEFLNFWL